MTAPDFAAILRSWLEPDARGWVATTDGVLGAKVPELCQTCGGTGERPLNHQVRKYAEPYHVCPDCPTIGRLLAIGTAVMTARMESPEGSGRQGVLLGGEYLAQSADRTIAYLRAVQP